METISYETIEELIAELPGYGCIHIECNREESEKIIEYLAVLRKGKDSGFLTLTDKGYERHSVKGYLGFFRELSGSKANLESVLDTFGLMTIRKQKMHTLKPGEYTKVGIARLSMLETDFCFLEEPLFNLGNEDMKRVLSWIEERIEAGVRFVTTNSSLRHAAILPGTAFYVEEGRFCQVEKDEDEFDTEDDVAILKIPVKSGNSTLLFEPGDIDYVESLNKCVYVSVRGTMFQAQNTLYEMEEILKKAGFFRCHRSFLVNIQKVERFEKWTKNSYVLILNNEEGSQIPLSKGRIEEMKETFHW